MTENGEEDCNNLICLRKKCVGQHLNSNYPPDEGLLSLSLSNYILHQFRLWLQLIHTFPSRFLLEHGERTPVNRYNRERTEDLVKTCLRWNAIAIPSLKKHQRKRRESSMWKERVLLIEDNWGIKIIQFPFPVRDNKSIPVTKARSKLNLWISKATKAMHSVKLDVIKS
jgi:hypothetical protein